MSMTRFTATANLRFSKKKYKDELREMSKNQQREFLRKKIHEE